MPTCFIFLIGEKERKRVRIACHVNLIESSLAGELVNLLHKRKIHGFQQLCTYMLYDIYLSIKNRPEASSFSMRAVGSHWAQLLMTIN